MEILIKKCPKCGYTRRPDELEDPERCPHCGLYFEKWANRDQFISSKERRCREHARPSKWRLAITERLTAAPAHTDPLYRFGYAGLLIFFLIWGIRLSLMDYENGEMSNSFMHAILLPIHEAGHIFLRPFGEFMTILGGSLFQILLPLIAAWIVLWENYDLFGASLGLWWCGISWMDLAAYIYDAKHPQLILLGGHTGEDGPHDWIYILGTFGKIDQSQHYGFLAHKLGVILMMIGLYSAFIGLKKIWKAESQLDK